MKYTTLIVAVGFAMFSCSTVQDSKEEIAGTYVREYSFKIVNQESGKEIGMRTVRDTIFLRTVESEYEVSNSKWKLNDYDSEGWQNMAHSDDRPMPDFNAVFDSKENRIVSKSQSNQFLNLDGNQLFKDKERKLAYVKVK
jgi:hypothetical protein